ncbi:hypothetical protein BLOT_014894 [Blomia tropicalis]|nr:hypothetical protein BLOT_014894 [Blomia tropicalis]
MDQTPIRIDMNNKSNRQVSDLRSASHISIITYSQLLMVSRILPSRRIDGIVPKTIYYCESKRSKKNKTVTILWLTKRLIE